MVLKMAFKDQNKKKVRQEIMEALALFSQIGFTIAGTLFLSIMLGRFIDIKMGTYPIFILVFSVLGIFAVFRILLLITKNQLKK